MRAILYILVSSLISTLASAADFQTSLEYCNNLPGDASNCPSLSTWQGVSLKDLSSVAFPIDEGEALIKLQDSFGNVWAQENNACKSKPSDLRGCLVVMDATKNGQTTIRISVWDIRKPQQNIALFIDGRGQLAILSDDGDHLVFSLK